MKKSIAILLSFLIITTASCKKETFSDLYAGAWEITFDGSFSGSKTMVIKEDKTFNFSIILSQGIWGSTTNNFVGEVSDKGKITSDIFISGDDVGDVVGNLEKNGTGTGIYVTDLNTEGTWIAIKK